MKKNILALTLILGCAVTQANDYTPSPKLSSAQIFAETCASCHGTAGAGKFGLLLKLTDTTLSSDQITNKISTGGTLMPAYPNINGEQLTKLATYIKTLTNK